MNTFHRNSVSNYLIYISAIATLFYYATPQILIYGMNPRFLYYNDYIGLAIQFLLYQFLHGGIFHLLSNSLFLFLFGNQLEQVIGKKSYILMFILNTFFTGIILLLFSGNNTNTIGISGFAMAILAYIFLLLRKNKHPDYKSAGLFLVINIFIGISGNISFLGHLGGAVFGVIYYYGTGLVKKIGRY